MFYYSSKLLSSSFPNLSLSLFLKRMISNTPLHSFVKSPISLLETCNTMYEINQIHSQTIKTGLSSNHLFLTKVIIFCCTKESGDVYYARKVFDEIPQPSVFIWNTMIKGYSRINCSESGVSLYKLMLVHNIKPDGFTFPFLLKGFTKDMALKYGKVLLNHAVIHGFLDSNLFVQKGFIHLFSLCGLVNYARKIFDMGDGWEVVTWNVVLSGYNRFKRYEESKRLFIEMEKKCECVSPNSVTLVLMLSACSKLKDLVGGKCIYNKYIKEGIVEPNLILENALIDMFASCGEMDAARGVFDEMKTRDVISWTSIVTGFANTCRIDLARKYFDQMPERDYVSWTAMIDGYLRMNRFKEVLTLFRDMQMSNVKPDEFTMVSILTACAHLGALELGEWAKTYIDKNKIKNDTFIGNALIDMYFKCGNVEKAKKIFNEMQKKDKFTWTAMIVGLANNGHGEEALTMFSYMLEASVTPDEITYIGVMCACTHVGLVAKGKHFFSNMAVQHGIKPNLTHYGCMVDLLGRAGHLKEALEVIMNMPVKPNSIVWGSLLGACRVHKNVQLAEMAANEILELEPENGAVYVLLCNIYAACKKWKNLHNVRKMMMERGIKKIPGCSLMEMNGIVYEFVAGDKSHPQSKEIYAKLENMKQDLSNAGYSPDTSEVFLDVGEEDKETALYMHSEKLAIAYALISSGKGVTIRIVKNLRMCVDCHHMAMVVSKVYNRELIVRDKTRFHHFRHGLCSCNNFW
ncbi:putative tetratricopeptide-like helical domain, DYW domain-containing protein [Medicago truncatula]|uniref:Putative tetratricopeptide-like helical domain, DYW domain-containing protein n=1 Tax=Medicago truncatula TaxID=3880 RepID=A0A396I2T5_MEDTR|nr:putative pentatricopeptide repeat-containing protein At3g15930 [Medicago truncatula]RHN58504.1 putative tetratricopeptide-like helical domain, DYW domain-containing protein [Medicago truncatula]